MTRDVIATVLTGIGVLLGVWQMIAAAEVRNTDRIETVRIELTARIDAAQAATTARIDAAQAATTARIDGLYELLLERLPAKAAP